MNEIFVYSLISSPSVGHVDSIEFSFIYKAHVAIKIVWRYLTGAQNVTPQTRKENLPFTRKKP